MKYGWTDVPVTGVLAQRPHRFTAPDNSATMTIRGTALAVD
jgi:hypothetical protein